MAEAIVHILLKTLAASLAPRLRPVSIVESELADIKWEVEQLKAFIGAASIREDEHSREIERQMREVVHDATELIQALEIQQKAANEINIFRRNFFRRKRRLSLAKELVACRQDRLAPMLRKAQVALDRMQIGSRSSISVDKQPMKAKLVPSIKVNNIVGFDEEEEIIINHLMEGSEELDVVSIAGMPGIGKTTLAWKICQNERVLRQFSTPIWIHVSEDQFHLRNVLLTILKQLTNEDISSMDEEDLVELIRILLESRMFLLVIDAIWAIDSLEIILSRLPEKPKMGKVLITTCNINLTANVRKRHILRLLSDTQSWEMLQLQVFGKLNDCPQRLTSLGECIAKNCDGLPLAIEVIGSSLVVASSTELAIDLCEKWWKKISENVMMYVKEYGQGRIYGSKALSYNKFSVQLRNCFLYFGVFPEDYEISAWTLTRLWIAEGFIECQEGQSLEETAEQSLVDLVNSTLVMVGKMSRLDGKVKMCRVHKVIHGFCNSKAAEMNFYHEMKMSNEGVFDFPPNCRRLCIDSPVLEFLPGEPNGRGVRSVLCLNKDHLLLDPKYNSVFSKSFHLLRILESSSIKFIDFPIALTKLIHLRYISLSSDDLNVLPEAISELLNLETLVVNTQSVLTVRANIWRMLQLRHLVTKAAMILAMERNGESSHENLQTLGNLQPEYFTNNVLTCARYLKKLGIRGKLATLLEAPDPISKLECLESLTLVNDLVDESAPDNQLHGLLCLNFFPPNLKSLTLSATYLDWKHMSELGKIVSLEFLKLKNNAFIGASWNTESNGFSRLQVLSIKTTDLVSWEASVACFPSLKCLVLKNCGKLGKIPSSIAERVEILDMDCVTKSAVESTRELRK